MLAPGLALIFDLDGVIVDSMPMHTHSWKLYLERHGIDAPDLVEKMHGRRNDEIVAEFWGDGLTPEENFQHGAAKEALWREMMEPVLESHLVPGVRSFLERYRESPIALGTNAEPANATFVLSRANLGSMFKAIVDGMQVAKPKPWPDVYCRASDLLGVEPSNCIVFEDSPTGVQAARAARMRVVGIRTHTDLEGVDFACKDFLDPALDAWLAQQTVRGSSSPR
ncbi:MAG TPA: HAD family phosphatase [Bryobacteraceae bacterium]|jgi:HAD superfamily hydrolase (TIGR01509 family)